MNTLANLNNPTVWIILLVVVLVLFGGTKIPEMMKGLGQGMRAFKHGMNEESDDELRRDAEHEAEVRKRVEEEMRKERNKGV